MKITIFGAGAIGGHLGALLSRNEVDVSLIARGAHLEAMRDKGLKLTMQGESFVTRPRVTDDPSTLGPQDYVVVSLKSHQAPGVVDAMQPMLGPDTTVVTAMNGVPWWYFYKLAGAHEDYQIKAVDPDGKQWNGIGPQRTIGCITYVASEVTAPGEIEFGGQMRYYIGEPDNSESERAKRFQAVVDKTAIDAQLRTDLRRDIWVKIMGNAAYNPISALTMGTMGDMVNDPLVEDILRKVMAEVVAVGRGLGAEPNASIEERIVGTRHGAASHKSSMLQDLERGRLMEINPIVGAVSEVGKLAGVATPTIDTVLALVRLRAKLAGLLPE
ncbi:MAG: 2-dehydropantoate 2-reductase [Proteobacteria bacterium]|nr:2-dehydropantoate 2-reductase [Pseudomonadota bacterium]